MDAETWGALFGMLLCAAGVVTAARVLPVGDNPEPIDSDEPHVEKFTILQARLEQEVSADSSRGSEIEVKENTMPPKAIGLLRLDVTNDRKRDEAVIGRLAHQFGYTLAGLVTITPDTYMPTTLVVHTVYKVGAAAIVTPDLAHFAGAARAVSLACDLVTPTGTTPRSNRGP
ncbi:hypothetical protein [Nocardia sp. CA-119907]|uniref:hypothetical protein n=1 Tax=Nocardia sp. CA-119907 TaxID=3239973 RepID=UPI003D972EDF